jgi:hypothetical protein
MPSSPTQQWEDDCLAAILGQDPPEEEDSTPEPAEADDDQADEPEKE